MLRPAGHADAGRPRRRQVIPGLSSLYDLYPEARASSHIYASRPRDDLVEKSVSCSPARLSRHVLPQRDGADRSAPIMPPASTSSPRCMPATRATTPSSSRSPSRPATSWLVPCCQAEVAARAAQHKNESFGKRRCRNLAPPDPHARFGSQLTNVLRCLQLESQRLPVTVTELVGWEHSLKNELNRRHPHRHAAAKSGERLQQIPPDTQICRTRRTVLAPL